MPSLANIDSRRQSWPPTQLRLVRSDSAKSIEPRPLLDDIDEDPLTYFLTPNLDNDEVCFTSDEDTEDDDDDEENEDYLRYFSSSAASPPRSPSGLLGAMPRHSFSGYPFGLRPRSPGFRRESGRSSTAFTSSSSSFPAPARPSSTAAAAMFYGRAPWAARRVSRPGHLWREPSADVWSIEEETAEELSMSEMRGRGVARREGGRGSDAAEAKPIKRVRFVLPGEE